MLRQTKGKAELAALHYELWKMMPGGEGERRESDDEHRQTALSLYQTLYEHTPNIEYKKRMEELQGLRVYYVDRISKNYRQ